MEKLFSRIFRNNVGVLGTTSKKDFPIIFLSWVVNSCCHGVEQFIKQRLVSNVAMAIGASSIVIVRVNVSKLYKLLGEFIKKT